MWLLTAAFFLRVVGQALVVFAGVTFLPPMEEWYSGLMAYHLLLPAQIVILALMLKINVDVGSGKGFFGVPRRILGRPLRVFGILYAAAMVLRYALTMALRPERRWLGGTIPIVFHLVLAAYLLILSRYQLGLAGDDRRP
jgi:hypothetical protein